jgi:hypothetical protein
MNYHQITKQIHFVGKIVANCLIPNGVQISKHCFLAMFLKSGQTCLPRPQSLSFARSSLVAGVRLYRACSARADLYITDI